MLERDQLPADGVSELPEGPREFRHTFFDRGEAHPVVLRGGGSAADARWSPAALAARFPDRRVTVRQIESRVFAIDPHSGDVAGTTTMTMSELVGWLGRGGGRQTYMMQQPIEKFFPELKSELPIPARVPETDVRSVNLWIGDAGNITRLHWDNYNNLLVQLSGSKRVFLLPPAARDVDASPATHAPHQADPAGPVRVNDALWPGHRCVLRPGEALFIPAFWAPSPESVG